MMIDAGAFAGAFERCARRGSANASAIAFRGSGKLVSMRALKAMRVLSSGSLKPGHGSRAFDVFSETDEAGFNVELIDID